MKVLSQAELHGRKAESSVCRATWQGGAHFLCVGFAQRGAPTECRTPEGQLPSGVPVRSSHDFLSCLTLISLPAWITVRLLYCVYLLHLLAVSLQGSKLFKILIYLSYRVRGRECFCLLVHFHAGQDWADESQEPHPGLLLG